MVRFIGAAMGGGEMLLVGRFVCVNRWLGVDRNPSSFGRTVADVKVIGFVLGCLLGRVSGGSFELGLNERVETIL